MADVLDAVRAGGVLLLSGIGVVVALFALAAIPSLVEDGWDGLGRLVRRKHAAAGGDVGTMTDSAPPPTPEDALVAARVAQDAANVARNRASFRADQLRFQAERVAALASQADDAAREAAHEADEAAAHADRTQRAMEHRRDEPFILPHQPIPGVRIVNSDAGGGYEAGRAWRESARRAAAAEVLRIEADALCEAARRTDAAVRAAEQEAAEAEARFASAQTALHAAQAAHDAAAASEPDGSAP